MDLRPTTLATIDEVIRATNALNGFAVAFASAIMEHLSKLLNVLMIFSTQLHWFCAISKALPMIINIFLGTVAWTEDHKYSYISPPHGAEHEVGLYNCRDVNLKVEFTDKMINGKW